MWACLATADAGLHSLKVQHLASGELQVEVASINQAPKEAVSTQVQLSAVDLSISLIDAHE